MAIEIDDSIHSNEDVKCNDVKRQTELESFGIIFLPFSNEQVLTQMQVVLKEIKNKTLTINNSPLGVGGDR